MRYVFLLLLSGCTVTPIPAHKLFGTSNPTAVVSTPEGTFKVPTNVKTRYKVTRKPDGNFTFDLTLASDAAAVVDAEGNRIDHMGPGLQANFAWATQATQMNHATADKALDRAFSLAETMIPILAAEMSGPTGPVDPNAPGPPADQIGLLELKFRRLLEEQQGAMLLRMQALIEANKEN